MPLVVSIDGLTPQQRSFAEFFAQGFTQTQAAKRAGYENASTSGADLLRNASVLAAIEEYRGQYVDAAAVTRKDVVEGIKEAIDMAKTMADPQTMIVGWRELGKMCGFYEPQKTEVTVTHNGTVRLDQLERMTDDELMKVIDADAIRIDDDPARLELQE